MSVRKTESRIPANFQATDFGEAVVAPDGRCALVSFITAPVLVDRENVNVYVLFVTERGDYGCANSRKLCLCHEPSATRSGREICR